MPGNNEDAVQSVIRQLGLDYRQAEELKQQVEYLKRTSGRQGDDNLDYYEILALGQEIKDNG